MMKYKVFGELDDLAISRFKVGLDKK